MSSKKKEKDSESAIPNFDIVFAQLQAEENIKIVEINAEVSKQAETIRLLREAAGDTDSAPFVTYSA